MALVLADVGAELILKAFFNNSFPSSKDYILHLFATNVDPADTDVLTTYTEAAGGNYSAITLTNGSFTVEDDGGGIMQASYEQKTFTFTGPLTTNSTVYGYYITNNASPTKVLVYAEKFGTPFTPANDGDTIKITVKFKMSKGTPT